MPENAGKYQKIPALCVQLQQRVAFFQADTPRGDQNDDAVAFQMRQCSGDGFDRKPEIIRDILPGHRKFDHAGAIQPVGQERRDLAAAIGEEFADTHDAAFNLIEMPCNVAFCVDQGSGAGIFRDSKAAAECAAANPRVLGRNKDADIGSSWRQVMNLPTGSIGADISGDMLRDST